MTYHEALHKALKVLNCLNNDRVYETAWVKGAINACEEALEQPTQEPMIIKQDNGMVLKLGYDDLPNGTPFYTHPKEWISLSDDEIIEKYIPIWGVMINARDRDETIEFARAIEAKLKEKNS